MGAFRQFLEESDPPDLYTAASDELNTQGEVGMQIFDWVPFNDGTYRFGQAFQVIKKDDDEDSDVVWVKPVTGKERGDEKERSPGPLELNVMKCARKHPNTGQMMQVKCTPLQDTKEFPIKKKQWTKMVNKPFAQMQQGGGMGGGMGGGALPGMM